MDVMASIQVIQVPLIMVGIADLRRNICFVKQKKRKKMINPDINDVIRQYENFARDTTSKLDTLERNISNLNQSINNTTAERISNRNVEQIFVKKTKSLIIFNILAICLIFATTVTSCIYYPSLAPFSITVGVAGCSGFLYLFFRQLISGY